jgi:hypothetical protein
MIGLGDRINGLYRLTVHKSTISPAVTTYPAFNHSVSINKNVAACNKDVNACNLNSSIIPVSALWHFRFGHASTARLALMHKLYPSICFNKDCVCDVCHLAKQKKLSYTLSSSQTSK